MPSSKLRLRHVFSLSAALVLGLPVVAGAADGIVAPTSTNLISTTKRMISYRHQRHMVQTSDGYLHLVINQGDTGDGKALALYSNKGDGKKWSKAASFGNSGKQSVSDSALLKNTLTTVYDGPDGIPRMATQTYDAVNHAWANKKIEPLPRPADADKAANPSFAVDGNGTTWVAYVAENTSTGNSVIALYGRAAGSATWVNSGQEFGPKDAIFTIPNVHRSARLVAVPGGIGMVYTVGQDMFWVGRPLEGEITSPWKEPKLLYTALGNSNEPMSSHFSTINDADGNLLLAFTDQGALYLQQRSGSGGTWLSPKMTILAPILNNPNAAVYAQFGSFGGNKLALVTNYGSDARVYQTSDGWATYVCSHSLVHATGDGNNYTEARVELPAVLTSPAPVVQQFIGPDGATQGAVFYKFKKSSTATCQ